MKRSKEENAVLDAAVLMTITREWATADGLLHGVRQALADAGARVGAIDATMVGARLRSLKSRGRVESRIHEDGYMSEWRRA